MKKIRSLMKTHQLDKVFVATDAIRKGRQFDTQTLSGRLSLAACWAGVGIYCDPRQHTCSL